MRGRPSIIPSKLPRPREELPEHHTVQEPDVVVVVSGQRHRPLRTLLSVIAIGVEVTMILTLVGVSNGTLDATARRARGVGADVLVRPPGSSLISLSTAPMSEKLVSVLAERPGVAIVTGTVVQPLSGFD